MKSLRLAAVVVCVTQAFNPARANAKGEEFLWALALGEMCIAQDQAYRARPFGNLLIRMFSERDDFDARPSTQCFRDRHWVPEALCADLMDADPNDLSKLEALHFKHRQETLALEPLGDYLTGVANGGNLPCPDASIVKRSR